MNGYEYIRNLGETRVDEHTTWLDFLRPPFPFGDVGDESVGVVMIRGAKGSDHLIKRTKISGEPEQSLLLRIRNVGKECRPLGAWRPSSAERAVVYERIGGPSLMEQVKLVQLGIKLDWDSWFVSGTHQMPAITLGFSL